MLNKDSGTEISKLPRLQRKLYTFITFLSSYLLVLLIPTTVAIALSFVTLNRIEESEKRAHEIVYVNLLNDLNIKVAQAHSVNYQVQNVLQASSYHLETVRDYYYEFMLRTELNQLMVGMQGVSNLYIYLPQFDTIITTTGSRSSAVYVADQYNAQYEEWIEIMQNSRNLLDFKSISGKDAQSDKRLLMYQSLGKVQNESGELTPATIVMELNLNRFSAMFERSKIDEGSGYALVLGDELIRSSYDAETAQEIMDASAAFRNADEHSGQVTTDDSEFIAFRGDVDFGKLSLLTMADLNMPLGWKQLTALISITLVFNVLASILISVMLARRKSRPIMRVEELLSEDIIGDTKNHSHANKQLGEYMETDELVASFVSRVKDYRAKVDYSAATVRDLYLEKLIKGEIRESEADIQSVFQLYGIKLDFSACRLAFILPAYKDDELAKDLWESQDIASTWHVELNTLLLTLHQNSVITYVYPDLHGEAYLLLYSEIGDPDQLNAAAPKRESAEDKELRNDRTGENIRILLSELNNLLQKNYGIGFTTLISSPVDGPSDFSNVYANLLSRKIDITKALQAGEQDVDEYSDLVINCLKIIQENYADQNLNVDYLAAALQVSQPYLSRLFKQQTGNGLLDYIHEYRIEQAKDYFRREPESLIKDVAEKCGFINAASFIRVFKKVYGDTPGQFRNSLLDL